MPTTGTSGRERDPRPNIILIITDQQRYDTIRALGYPHMDTPNLDRLVEEGVTFTNSFITAPSCAALRGRASSPGYYSALERASSSTTGTPGDIPGSRDLAEAGLLLREHRQDAHHPLE